MPLFIFKAKKNGEVHKGEQDAKDRFELYRLLKESGEEVISVEERKRNLLKNILAFNLTTSVKMTEKINFCKSLGAMIKAGLSMTQGLGVMERQGTNKAVRKIIASLNDQIRQGKTLSEAMKPHKKMFSPLMVAMVASGEQSGTLAESLSLVTMQMEKSYALQKRIRGALMYPGIIFMAMIIIGVILLTYVVPTLTKTFSSLNVALPKSTRFVIWISDLLRHDSLLLILTVAVVIGGGMVVFRRPAGKRVIHFLMLKIPVIGRLVQEVNVARTARTLSSLIGSGVDVLEALRITGDIVQNVHYKKVLEKAHESVEKGEPLSKTFGDNQKFYPVFLSEMVSVGEETGKIGEMMIGVANYYEDDVDQRTKDMSTIIEPFLMIVIAAAVGFFAIAMISPMYSLVNVI